MEISLRRLSYPGDTESLQEVLDGARDFYALTGGRPPDAREIFDAPPGTDPSDHFVFLVMRDGQSAGFADILRNFPEAGTAVLVNMVLLPERRDLGNGTSAYQVLETTLRGWGIEKIRLGTFPDVNPRAIRFWERQGFARTGEAWDETVGAMTTPVAVLEKRLLAEGVG